MLRALYNTLQIDLLKMLAAFLVVILFYENIMAQPNPNPTFRILAYNAEFIYGTAPAGSVIKLYYANPGEFTRKSYILITTLTVDPSFNWGYSIKANTLHDFEGPVVAYIIRPGTTEEVPESSTLGSEEFWINQERCSDIPTVQMLPGPTDVVFTWKDKNGVAVSHESVLTGQPAGTYTLEYKNRGERIYTSEPLTIAPSAPHIENLTSITLNCGESSGKVLGSTMFQGPDENLTYIWEKQESGALVSQKKDAMLQPGKYYFSVKTINDCVSNKGEVIVNAAPPPLASINQKAMVKVNASCGQSNGSITGITVKGANGQTPTCQWLNSSGKVYATTLDIVGLPPDTYTLMVKTTGSPCPVYLNNIVIDEMNAITLDDSKYVSTPTSCGLNNGSVTGLISNATGIRWYNQNRPDVIIPRSLKLENAAPGYYMLQLTNNTGCIKEFGPFHIVEGSPAIEILEEPVITPDNCSLGTGSIIGVKVNTSVKYTWLNEAGEEVGSGSDLYKAPAGKYTLYLQSDKCDKSVEYVIENGESVIEAPVMNNIVICAPSNVLINFKETADIYRIYNVDGVLLAQSSGKDFRIKVNEPGIFYAALAKGNCESERTMFSISFGSSGLNIPSAFSPNNDGVNDNWIVKGLEVYTSPEVKIFNRQGSIVFKGEGQSAPFNGKENGHDLPVGVYYYVIKASPDCAPESGSLTLIR